MTLSIHHQGCEHGEKEMVAKQASYFKHIGKQTMRHLFVLQRSEARVSYVFGGSALRSPHECPLMAHFFVSAPQDFLALRCAYLLRATGLAWVAESIRVDLRSKQI